MWYNFFTFNSIVDHQRMSRDEIRRCIQAFNSIVDHLGFLMGVYAASFVSQSFNSIVDHQLRYDNAKGLHVIAAFNSIVDHQ